MDNVCKQCGEQVSVFKRFDSKFCSPKCKQRAYRLRCKVQPKGPPVTPRGARRGNARVGRNKLKGAKYK